MKSLRTPLFLFLLFCFSSAFAQTSVSSAIQHTADTATLSVIRVFPDSFPDVSVIFKAERRNGDPIWDLTKEQVSVTESGQAGTVKSLEKISKNQSVKIMLVADHSGSMSKDAVWDKWAESLQPSDFTIEHTTVRAYSHGEIESDAPMDVSIAPPNPSWYHSPIEYARMGMKSFINSFDAKKDSFGIIGFSDTPDVDLAMTNNVLAATNVIDKLYPDGGTALYDAVYSAISKLSAFNGIRAVVVLTDGQDNSSTTSISNVIALAQKYGLQVYTIGLGDVDRTKLKKLADETGGQFYYTPKASQLSEIYQRISRRLQAVYELHYSSPNLATNDTTREIQLQFAIDNLYLDSSKFPMTLPQEVVKRLREKAAAATVTANVNTSDSNTTVPIIISVSVAVAGAGTLLIRRRKKNTTNTLRLLSIFPNPTDGPLTIQWVTSDAFTPVTIMVNDATGIEQLRETAGTGEQERSIDLSALPPGTYLLVLQQSSSVSNAMKIIRR